MAVPPVNFRISLQPYLVEHPLQLPVFLLGEHERIPDMRKCIYAAFPKKSTQGRQVAITILRNKILKMSFSPIRVIFIDKLSDPAEFPICLGTVDQLPIRAQKLIQDLTIAMRTHIRHGNIVPVIPNVRHPLAVHMICLLYTSDAADDLL